MDIPEKSKIRSREWTNDTKKKRYVSNNQHVYQSPWLCRNQKYVFGLLADEGDFGIYDSGALYNASESGRLLDLKSLQYPHLQKNPA
jgi:hypothetical protein